MPSIRRLLPLALLTVFALLAIVFPSGRLADGRWGTVTRIALASGLLLMAATFVMPTIKASIIGHPESVVVRNPFALFPDLAVYGVIPNLDVDPKARVRSYASTRGAGPRV